MGHVTLVSPTFVNFARNHVRTIAGACLSIMKSAHLTILEQLAFNAPKFLRVTTLASGLVLFLKILRGHFRTVPENMRVRVKFEVLG